MLPTEGAPLEVFYCSECGRASSAEEIVCFGERRVCALCKDAFTQRLREGGLSFDQEKYGGFWIRAAATTMDGILTSVVLIPLQLTLVMVGAVTRNPFMPLVAGLAGNAIGMVLNAVYETFFLARYGATPGKMMCRLRVVRADGQPLTWQLALGRHFARYISWIICWIGVIMAGFDDQKRALHDHICSTRVVKKAA